MTYEHGTQVVELSTKLQVARTVASAVPFVVGTSAKGKRNEPKYLNSLTEAVQHFGDEDPEESYSLPIFFKIFFQKYQVRPVIAVSVGPELLPFSITFNFDENGEYELEHTPEQLVLRPSNPVYSPGQPRSPGFIEGVDYELDGKLIRVIEGGAIIIEGQAYTAEGTYYEDEMPTADDVIGTVDPVTGQKTGLELVDQVFNRYGIIPGFLIAPGWSHNVSVTKALAVKAKNINDGMFKCVAVADISDEDVPYYSQVPQYKTNNSLVDSNLILCWPRVKSGAETEWLSSHLTGLMAQVDSQNDDVPFVSPSNQPLSITGTIANNETVWLDQSQANFLNANGVVTVLNNGRWVAWGNRTSAFPVVSDYKDIFIPVRRIWSWISNTLILSNWPKVSRPLSRNAVESVVVSANAWLNGLVSDGKLLSGRVEFLAEENPDQDLLNGICRLHVFALPIPPMVKIEFPLEIDVSGFDALRAQLTGL